mmetsp:Transcript_92021/g.159648  ORF Transcript_92021/g.159648 Transcript_92021/m.159648 type:complete len:381 (+) Transcript_92021:76-1218(+)
MATFDSFTMVDAFSMQLGGPEPLADQLNIASTPQIWFIAALIPLSLYVCTTPSIGMGFVLVLRLLVILAMNFVQKMSVKSWPLLFLLQYQMALQVVLIAVYNFRNLKFGKWSDLGWWLLFITPAWIAQLITSLHAFKEASLSFMQIVTTVQPIVSLAMEKMLRGLPKRISLWLMASMILVVLGITLYGYSTVSATPSALRWILVNVVLTVVTTVFRSWFLKDANFTVSLPLAMCSVAFSAIPIIWVTAYSTGEIYTWHDSLRQLQPTAWFWATMSSLVAGCFSFLQFRCQTIISGTSDLMFQSFVKVLLIVMGIVVFAEEFNMESFLGCIIALGGCAWYGKLRLVSEVKEGAEEQAARASVAPEGYRQLGERQIKGKALP